MDTENKSKDEFILTTDGRLIPKGTQKVAITGGDDLAFYVGSFGQIGFALALPLAVGVIVGSLLDKKFGMYPNLTLTGLGVGVVLSFVGLYQAVRDVIRKSDALTAKVKKQKDIRNKRIESAKK